MPCQAGKIISNTEGNTDVSLTDQDASAENPNGKAHAAVIGSVDTVMKHHLQETSSEMNLTKNLSQTA